jgi:hypothetical protein
VFARILPRTIDNTFPGYTAALWLYGLVIGVRTAQSLAIIFNGYATARDADGIPLDTYPPETARQVVAIFAQQSLWRLTFCVLGIVVLVRYRSAVPLMFALLLLNYLGSQLILYFVPLIRVGTPAGPYVNLAQFVLTVLGLALSVRSRGAPGLAQA